MMSLKEFKETELVHSNVKNEIKGGIADFVITTAWEADHYINSGGQHITTYIDGMNMGTDFDGY